MKPTTPKKNGGYTWPKVVIFDKDLDLKATHPTLWERFNDFFVFTEQSEINDSTHTEHHLYDQFLLDQPKNQGDKVDGYVYTRDELLYAMHSIYKRGDMAQKTHQVQKRHGDKGRVCKRDFATCLAAMGGRHKSKNGKRYWTNVEIGRRPRCIWWPL